MKNLIISLFILFSYLGYSQYCPSLGPDQLLPCGVNSTTLTADLSQCGVGSNPNQTTTYNVSTIPYVAQTNTGNTVQLSDDSHSNLLPIGFSFCFFGNTYTQFIIGSNGWISFTPPQPNTFATTSIPSVGGGTPKNCIMGPWQDWNPSIGGQIRYQLQGVAPCRKLVVSWTNMPMYSCTNLQGTFHIVLYESTNFIENYIASKPNCPQWAGGTAVQGVHNLPGTIGITIPGRNSTQWTTQNDARRYTPAGPPIAATPTWYQVGNPVSIGTGLTITVTPPLGGANYTCHLEYPSCNAGWATCNSVGVGLGPDTVMVSPGPPNLPLPTIVALDPNCNGGCDGSINLTPVGGAGVITISWVGQPSTFNLINLCPGTYTYNLADAGGCTLIGNVILNNPPPFQPPLLVNINPTCFGYCDGQSVVNPTDGVAPYTFLWSNGQTTQIINNLCAGNYTCIVTDFYGCTIIGTTILIDPPQIIINPISGLDTLCYNSSLNIFNISSPPPNLTYVWSNTNGTITSGQGTTQINLDVNGVVGGFYPNMISVYGQNALGCLSQTENTSIEILNILPVITQIGPYCEYDNCITMTAFPIGGTYSGGNITGNQYCPINGFIGLDNVTYVYNQLGCTFNTNIDIQVYPRPTVSPVVDGRVGVSIEYHEICEGDSIQDLYGAVSPSGGYNEWYVFGDTLQGPTINITWDQDGVFTFDVVRWDNGCVSFPETFIITLEPCPSELIFIPNTFTPDGDEHNNNWSPIFTSGFDPFDFHLTLFNRWGEIIFESFNSTDSWDGTYNNLPVQSGVYTWFIQYGDKNNDKKSIIKGNVTIVR